MSEKLLRGTISFVNHDKHYATIDYDENGKKKSVNCKTDKPESNKGSKKNFAFRIGDTVDFQVKRSEKGDKMIAFNVKFLYNQELEKLINKSATENRFSGYLKVIDDQLFVKEWESYIFFPLKLSAWENPPAESAFNESISFKLINTDKPHAIGAELFSHDFIPEFREALLHFNNKKPMEVMVSRVSPYAGYLDLFGNSKLMAKIELSGPNEGALKPGDKIKVIITHLSSSRIVVKLVK